MLTAPLRRIGDGLAVLAGAHRDVLEAAPGARARFVALGGVLLSTGGLALVSAAFAVHMALAVWWPAALLVGLGWGVVIVNLDRMLLVGMAHDSSIRRNAVLAVPRIALALVLGVVIATPLTLQVFHREIDTEIVPLQAEAADAYRKSLDTDARFRGLPALREKIGTEQAVLASGGHSDPALKPLRDQLTARQADFDRAVGTYQQLGGQAQCELNGTCGTRVAGDGEAYQGAKAAVEAQSGVVAAARAELEGAVSALRDGEAHSATAAQADLAVDQAELAGLTADQKRLQAAFDATNKDNGGILIRLQALSRLSDRSVTLGMAHRMLALLFICIELLPMLMKVLLNFGPPSVYDRLSELRDRSDVEVAELQQRARRTVEEERAELLVLAERERVERQKEAILARKRLAEARQAEARQVEARQAEARAAVRVEPEQDLREFEESVRRIWDTGPILGLARTAAARTVRSMTRRTGERMPTAV